MKPSRLFSKKEISFLFKAGRALPSRPAYFLRAYKKLDKYVRGR